MNAVDLFSALHREGLRSDAASPSIPERKPVSPWYARALLGVCGWIGGLFVIGAFGGIFVGLFNNAPGLSLLAAILVGIALWLYRRGGDNEVVTQFAFASSIAGQVAAGAALAHLLRPDNHQVVFALALAVLQLVLIGAMPNRLHRLASTMFAVAALVFAAHNTAFARWLPMAVSLATVAVWLRESDWIAKRQDALWRPVGHGLLLSTLVIEVVPWVETLTNIHGSSRYWLSPFVHAPALALLVLALTRRATILHRALAISTVAILCAASGLAPGLAAAACVLLIGFACGNRAITGLGLLGSLAYLGLYYYRMDTTLLVKATALAASGVALLAARSVMALAWRREETT